VTVSRILLIGLVFAACATSPRTRVKYMPFGAAQFQNGETGKGVAFAVVEGAAVVTSASLWFYLNATYGNEPVPAADAATVRKLQITEVVSGVAFFATYAAGVVEGLLHDGRRTRLAPTLVGGAPGLVWSWSK
jgi:hypothetical protein